MDHGERERQVGVGEVGMNDRVAKNDNRSRTVSESLEGGDVEGLIMTQGRFESCLVPR